MLNIYRASEVVTSVLHAVGGLYATVAHLVEGDTAKALKGVLIIAACILVLAGAEALAQFIRLLMRWFTLWFERRFLSTPHNKGAQDA